MDAKNITSHGEAVREAGRTMALLLEFSRGKVLRPADVDSVLAPWMDANKAWHDAVAADVHGLRTVTPVGSGLPPAASVHMAHAFGLNAETYARGRARGLGIDTAKAFDAWLTREGPDGQRLIWARSPLHAVEALLAVEIAEGGIAHGEDTYVSIRTDMGAPVRTWHAIHDTGAIEAVRSCRICGCTDDDCTWCVERTGEPCTWATDDLCSACVDDGPGTGQEALP